MKTVFLRPKGDKVTKECSGETFTRTIDDRLFTQAITMEDDVQPDNLIGANNVLVAVVENVSMKTVDDHGPYPLYNDGPLKGRIIINGKLQQ